jgi:hypothetical protein
MGHGTRVGEPPFSKAEEEDLSMTSKPRRDPTLNTPKAPRQVQQGKDVGPKLGRDKPLRGLDTGVDVGAIQPGASGDNDPLK